MQNVTVHHTISYELDQTRVGVWILERPPGYRITGICKLYNFMGNRENTLIKFMTPKQLGFVSQKDLARTVVSVWGIEEVQGGGRCWGRYENRGSFTNSHFKTSLNAAEDYNSQSFSKNAVCCHISDQHILTMQKEEAVCLKFSIPSQSLHHTFLRQRWCMII